MVRNISASPLFPQSATSGFPFAMASLANFVCLVPQPEAEVLKGIKAQQPLTVGDMIIGYGTFADGSEVGPGIFLVLRQTGANEYVLSPLGSPDEYWETYLAKAPTGKAVIWRDAKDEIPGDKELLRRWKIISNGEVPKKKDYAGFPKQIVEGLARKWQFLSELVVSEKPPPQAGNDHISGNRELSKVNKINHTTK